MATTHYGTRVGVESTVAKRTGRTTGSVGLPSLAFAFAVLALVLAPGALATNAAGRPAPQRADPSGTAKRLVNRYFVLVADKDRAELRRFLSPGFQVQRADGSGAARGTTSPTCRRSSGSRSHGVG